MVLARLIGEEGPDREQLYYRCFCLLRYMIAFLQNQEPEKGAETLEKVSALNLGDTSAFLKGMQEAVEEICSREADPLMDSILEYIRENFWRTISPWKTWPNGSIFPRPMSAGCLRKGSESAISII